jgi:hypothetical protein
MMNWLAGILGAVCGAIVWSMLLRLPLPLARWLCAPFGKPRRGAMIVSMTFSVVFLSLVSVSMLLKLSSVITNGYGHTMWSDRDLKILRGIIFISSWLGYAVVPIVMRLEKLWNSGSS